MKSYFCYIHTANSVTPQMRVLSAEHESDLAEAIGEALAEWPQFEVIDVYNDRDESVLRLATEAALSPLRH